MSDDKAAVQCGHCNARFRAPASVLLGRHNCPKCQKSTEFVRTGEQPESSVPAKPRRWKPYIVGGALAVGVLLVVAIQVTQWARRSAWRAERAEVYAAAQRHVSSALKAPSSAVFPSLEGPAPTGVVILEPNDDDRVGVWEVMGHVDRQNAFGASVRERFTVRLRNVDDRWHLDDLKMEGPKRGL